MINEIINILEKVKEGHKFTDKEIKKIQEKIDWIRSNKVPYCGNCMETFEVMTQIFELCEDYKVSMADAQKLIKYFINLLQKKNDEILQLKGRLQNKDYRKSGTLEYTDIEEKNTYRIHLSENKIIEISKSFGRLEIWSPVGKIKINPGYTNVIYIDIEDEMEKDN